VVETGGETISNEGSALTRLHKPPHAESQVEASVKSQGAPPRVDPGLRTRQAMLEGPVLATLVKLAWPTVLVIVAQVFVGVAEMFYVSFLGTAALAGVTLVFPIMMLMSMMSNGGIGGGVSAAVARAIGARHSDDTDALVLHALIVAIVFGLAFTAAMLLFGPTFYAWLGGTGEVLDAARMYSGFVFIGAGPVGSSARWPRRFAAPGTSGSRRSSRWCRRQSSWCCPRRSSSGSDQCRGSASRAPAWRSPPSTSQRPSS
jgi:hypothetical protein